MQPTVGFIGLGLMGSAMVRRLLAAGYRVLVWNRTRSKAEGLFDDGAEWCESAGELAARVPVVMTMLSTPEVVAVIAAQIRTGSEPGSLHVDCSTIGPVVTEQLAGLALAGGKRFVHAPVLGSVPQATEGSLLIFAGGQPDDVARARPMLTAVGKKVYEFSDVSHATNTKLLANFFIAGMIGTLAQGILFARAAGIDIATFLDILGQSALNAPMYQTKAPAMESGDYTPRFYLEHMHKDVHLAAASADAMGVTLPYMPLLAKLLDDGMAMGLAKKDYSAVLEVLATQCLKR